jgi:Tfp pilus assembly protein PilV
MPPVRPFLLRRLAAEDGIMLLEVLIAILVLTVGLLGLIGAFDSGRKLNLLSERRTSMAHRAQLEIERLQAIPYAELAMSEPAPTHSTEPTNPDYYVKEGTTKYQYGEKETETESLVYPGGKVSRTSTGKRCSNEIGACEWEDGHVRGNVYDFVTWHQDKICETKTENYKRLTVAVTATVPGGNHQPTVVRVSTLIASPKETKEEIKKTC